MLVFSNETRFYRAILGISYEFGSELKRKEILEPDAVMDDGRLIYSMSQEAIERHQKKLETYRARTRRIDPATWKLSGSKRTIWRRLGEQSTARLDPLHPAFRR